MKKKIRRFPRLSPRRFPRLPEDFPELVPKKKKMFMGVSVEGGRIPRNYNKLTKKQKRAIRLVVNGMTINDMCRKVDIHHNTWYRWLHLHEKFKHYYLRYANKQALVTEGRLDAKVGRAVQVVESSLDSADPYFAHDAAVKLLSGRGLYKKNVEQNKHVSGSVMHGVVGKVEHQIVDKDLMVAFVDALTGKAIGAPEHKEKVINAKVLKSLPEPRNGINTEIQKIVEAEAVRSDSTS